MENVATEAAPRGDHSISELRAMLTGEPPKPAAAAESKTAAPAEGEGAAASTSTESEPASGTDEGTQEGNQEGRERGPDGKFKPAEGADDTPGVKKRIGKVLGEKRAAEERAEAAERKLAELQGSRPGGAQQQSAAPNAQTPPANAAAKAPEPGDFDDYGKYITALTKHAVEEARASDRAAAETTRRETEQRKEAEGHAERVEKAKERHPDWDTALNSVKVPISQELHIAIQTGGDAELDAAYFVATHPDEATRISKLTPMRQVAEFAKIAARFEAQPANGTTTTTEKKPLPKPPANVGGSTGAAKEPELSDRKLPMSEFKKRARALLR